jgi:hypothetical protein
LYIPFFASTLIGQQREIERIRAFGTDGEQALVDAFKHELPFAHHLTCFIHVRRNIKDKLRECNIPPNVSTDIVNDVLGARMGTTYVEGLVDASDSFDFDEKLNNLIIKWKNVETTSTSTLDEFISWFENHKAPVIRRSMLKNIREESGLGFPPKAFTTNASETANYMLKS